MSDLPYLFFLPEPEVVLVQHFGHSSHQDTHQGLGWGHLSGQAQSRHTTVMLLLSAPQGLAPSSRCTFGAHLCLAGFTGIKFPLLLLPTGIDCFSADFTNNVQVLCVEVQM